MRIVQVIPEAAKRAGGIDTFLIGLNSALVEKGLTIETLENVRCPGRLPDGNVYHFHGLWQPASNRIAKLIEQKDASYIVSPHGMLEPWAMRHRFWKKIPYFFLRESSFLRNAKRLLATSEMEARNIRYWVRGSQPCALPLGITRRRFPSRKEAREKLGWRDGDRVLLFLSRLHPKKGLELLLKALAAEPQLARDGWRLVLVGDGDAAYQNKLRQLAEALSGLPPIDWIGPVWDDRKWDYFSAADVFCLPTYSENFGLAVLEALACGTPVITTNTTPWQPIADWPGCAIVSPDVRELRQALARMNPDFDSKLRSELSHLAFREYGWDKLVDRYIEFYAQACAK